MEEHGPAGLHALLWKIDDALMKHKYIIQHSIFDQKIRFISNELNIMKERLDELRSLGREWDNYGAVLEANKLQNNMDRVVELNRELQEYRAAGLVLPSRPPIDSRPTALSVDPGNLVGLDGPIEKVIEMVMDAGDGDGGKAKLKIVSIVGMAGSGKTTLANAVYRLLVQKNCFQCRAFISVGQEQSISKTLMDMLSQLYDGRLIDDGISPLMISRLSRGILMNKRYLIVVDDLWSWEHWQTIRQCFPQNSLGSRIITTTRNAALVMESDSIYNIGLLSEIDSRQLFLNITSGTGHGCSQYPEDLFPQETRRCGGLPLALVTLASLLTDQSSTGEWERPIGPWWLSSSKSHHVEVMKQILNLSYKDLPRHLKPCFLYLSIFPQYCEVEVERLVMLWIAEGFIPEVRGRTGNMEETARNYLNGLINRNMVQPLRLNHDGFPRYIGVHPVIHDFVVCKSMESKFVTLVNVQDHLQSNNGIVRRLSVQSNSNHKKKSNSNQDQAVPRNDHTDLSNARSIIVFGQASATPQLTDNLKKVRILDLEGCDGPVCLDGLSKLVLLRYLSLRGTGVSKLPATIGELRFLRYLILRGTDVSELPATIGELRFLRYLSLRGTGVSELPATIEKLVLLRYLSLRGTGVSELPTTIGELRCLETLDARSTKVKELPQSIVKLKRTLKALLVNGKRMINLVEKATRMPEDTQHCQRLEKLGIIDLREHQASFVKALGGLNSLKVLKITWSSQQSTERAYREALVSSVKMWSQLESLTIHCEFGCSMEFLGSLPSPPEKLKKFKVTTGKFVDVPQWVSGFEFLSFLQITLCKLCSDGLSILRNLPKLKCLILGLEFILREAIVIENDGFSELTRFSVDCPVPWLTFRTGAMPKVTNLKLKFCSGPASQESVPSGIDNLGSLTEVALCYNHTWCANSSSVKMTVEAVKKEVAKHCKTVKLVINDTVVNVQEVEKATEAYNEAEHGDEAKHDVQIAGEGTNKVTSEIEEIEDDTNRGS